MTGPNARATSKCRARLTLVSRSACHLCDEMQEALEALAPTRAFDLEILKVDEHPRLEERFGAHVPVLLAGNIELCRYRLDRPGLDAYLSSRGAPAPQGQIG